MELELILCVFVDFFLVTSVNMERMSREWTRGDEYLQLVMVAPYSTMKLVIHFGTFLV